MVVIQRKVTFTLPLLAVLYHSLERPLRTHRVVRTVDQLRAVVHDPLNGALLLEMPDSHPGKTAVDLQPLNQDRLRDELEGRNFLQNTIVDGLVEDNGMDCFVLDLSLGPFLLLCGFTATRCRGLSCAFGGLQNENCQLCGADERMSSKAKNRNPS